MVAKNALLQGDRIQYKFQIWIDKTTIESPLIEQGKKETSWVPPIQLRPGATYRWRVWVVESANKRQRAYSFAEATFLTRKATPKKKSTKKKPTKKARPDSRS